MSDILKKLLASFWAEHKDHLDKIRVILAGMAKAGSGPGPELEEAFRRAHSLKGAARAVDLRAVESLAHCVETIFSRVREGLLPLDKKTLKTIALVLDSIEDWVAAYFKRQSPPEPVQALDAVEALLGNPAPAPRAAANPAEGTPPAAEDTLSVGVAALERLLAASDRALSEALGQKSVSRTLALLEDTASGLESEWARSRRSRHDGRADSVERRIRLMSRQLREARTAHDRKAWAIQSSAERLREEVLQVRLVPAEGIFSGLRKMARDLARDEGKEIEFRAEGLNISADRLVLQALKDPVMHLLRNAVTHGIEAPEDRKRRGKEPAGTLTLRLTASSRQLKASVEDDGRGVDWKAVGECAVRRKFLKQDQAASASREELSRLLFLPGFSTSEMVTDLAGRGMGLSVAAEAVRRLQGGVSLDSREGQGITVSLTVPLTLATRGLLVLRSSGQEFALPVDAIAGLKRLPLDKLETVAGNPVVSVDGRPMPLYSLSELIGVGDSALKIEGETLAAAVLQCGREGLALAVDGFVTEIDGIIKNLNGGAQKAKCFLGAVIKDDGRALLVLDPEELAARARGAAPTALKTERASAAQPAPAVLVVDDSITTRTLEKHLLEAHGYLVHLAVDGEEALQKLKLEKIDLAVVDIQMPRMNGFELIAAMKKDPRLSKLPVIIVSSLESREEKERGLALGADAYLIKRKFDHRGLLDTIRQILRP